MLVDDVFAGASRIIARLISGSEGQFSAPADAGSTVKRGEDPT